MAKVTIEIIDKPDGTVGLQVTNDPPSGDKPLTPAQKQAVACLRGMAYESVCESLSRDYASPGGGTYRG